MGKILKNALKAAVIMFAVGALLSFALPYFATFAGFTSGAVSGVSASPIYMGLMFGGFGALNEVIRPACEAIIGNKQETEEKTKIIVIEKSPEPTIPIRGVAPVLVVDNDKQAEFVKNLTDKRLKDLENQLGR